MLIKVLALFLFHVPVLGGIDSEMDNWALRVGKVAQGNE